MNSNNSENPKKNLYRFGIPALLVLILLAVIVILNPFGSGNKTSATGSKSISDTTNASVLEKPKVEAALSNKEDEKKSQQINSFLKQKRKNNGIEFNWYMGWWDVEAKKACGVIIPNVSADSGVAEVPKNLLRDLIPAPKKPEKKNVIQYPDYKIEAPIVHTNMEDRFQKNSDGTLNFNITSSGEDLGGAIQKKLESGPITLAMSPEPGEIGNSYISGHTSNYDSVVSDFKTVFKPIERKSKPGEVFYIYDCLGRKLAFKVFEAKEIDGNDADQAWRDYSDKRVVTLQGSILVTRADGRLYPDKRWITRGELDLEESKKLNAGK
jgi:Sortase domain